MGYPQTGWFMNVYDGESYQKLEDLGVPPILRILQING
jgi:hypothetical protein